MKLCARFESALLTFSLASVLSVSIFSVDAAAQDIAGRVVLQPGDTQSAAALVAIARLREDPQLEGIDFVVLPEVPFTASALQPMGPIDYLLTARHGRQLGMDDLDAIIGQVEAGASVIGMVPGVSPALLEAGVTEDPRAQEYFSAGGADNLEHMIRELLARRILPNLAFNPAIAPPEAAYFEPRSRTYHLEFASYAKRYRQEAALADTQSRPWIGLALNRSGVTAGDIDYILDILRAFERKGMAVVPFFNYPAHADLDWLLLDENGAPRVAAIAAISFKLGVVPDQLIPQLERIGVPVISGIRLASQTSQDWEASETGIGIDERSWLIGTPELAGAIAPTVIAGTVTTQDPDTGISISRTQAIAERVERWVDRVAAWVELSRIANAEKKVALVYYNYPPGNGNVGASYLNVLPESLWNILHALQENGYTLGTLPDSPESLRDLVRDRGSNPDQDGESVAARLAMHPDAVTLPVAEYEGWLQSVSPALRDAITAHWGEPENSHAMIWNDAQGTAHFVFPALRLGNVLMAAQPTRGWDLDIEAAYHDTVLPPHHYYLAFYLWLQKTFAADAMVHVGTHATHEWLPGKEVGLSAGDVSDVMTGAVPQLYPYIVDNIGEGQQAKRRGMAVIISHLTPPISTAALNPELRALSSAITDLTLSRSRGSLAIPERAMEVTEAARRLGLLTDLDISLDAGAVLDGKQVEAVEHHIKEIGETLVPFGLHTFGLAPDEQAREATALAMASVHTFASDLERQQFIDTMSALLADSGPAEMNALLSGLQGRYISAGPGNDPIRNPAALPTGKNFYGFDPSRVPAPAIYRAGQQLAEDMINDHREANAGAYPDRLIFNLFSVESNRNEGVQEAQIMALLGVRPVWDSTGRVSHVELVSREELGRPRVDVTVLPSGLYRDVFAEVLLRLDDAVALAAQALEPDNPIAANVGNVTRDLLAQNVPQDMAQRLAMVRIFGTPTGSYGPGLDTPINAETSWQQEEEIADVYFNRLSHLFGRGFWGERPDEATTGIESGAMALTLLKQAFTGADAVVHSRSSNLYATLDNDDFYQALGGAAMAVRIIDGQTPQTLVTDLSDPRQGNTVTLERFMGQELRARYLNPEWIDAMLDEGYAGARFVKQVTDNLWGWQVTVPEAIDAAKWQEMFEVYVEDRYELDIHERMAASNNLEALLGMVQRMQAVVAKQYWNPDPTLRAELDRVEGSLISEIQARDAAPGNEAAISAPDLSAAPGESQAQAQTQQPEIVEGRVMETLNQSAQPSSSAPNTALLLIVLLSFLLIAAGWLRQSQHRRAIA
jgi:cobaltochelatase CobN